MLLTLLCADCWPWFSSWQFWQAIFLLARASVTLSPLRNTQVVELLSQVLEHLVTGEIMQLSSEYKNMSK